MCLFSFTHPHMERNFTPKAEFNGYLLPGVSYLSDLDDLDDESLDFELML